MSRAATPVENFAVLLGLAWLAVAAQLLVLYWAGTADILADTDDAMRLVELRAYLGGQGWFDLHEPRIDPPAGYDTHWSRLIDAGLAGLLRGLSLVAEPALAERLMRTLWPLLWLVPAMAGVLLLSLRLAGPAALAPAALLLVLGLPAFQQFVPGRIDHHNVQITLAVLALAATTWSDRRPWAAAAAGLLSALALAIGFESLAVIALCGAAMALRFCLDREPGHAAAAALSVYGLALAGGTAAAFVGTIAPARWGVTACDALALNTALPVVAAGLGLAATGLLAPAGRTGRLVAVGVLGLAVAALSLAIEPACRRGPFAMMDPAVGAIWLDHVKESQPFPIMARVTPAIAATVAAFPLIALVAAAGLARHPSRRRDFGFAATAAAMVLAALLTLGNAKLYVYATWFGMPVVAAALAGLGNARLSLRVAAAVLLAPAVAGVLAASLTRAVAGPGDEPAPGASARACLTDASYRALAALPPGLVVTAIDYGPFVLALTPHAVLGGPYHRLSRAILATDRLFRLPPEAARPVLDGLASGAPVTYLAVCRTAPAVADRAPDGLEARLAAGRPPDWLVPVGQGADTGASGDAAPLAVYRMETGPQAGR
ncbi:hypothetical protein [Rhodoplanes roseus]|uniref:Glycosyltransferase RgtA/B/C/D-like domain-containing protein n=1 Tax=Rhodoplanes roseus TaxID=29409 RepID=A0A327L6N6_9BRAD|nr:hypothetical protein [Rhodoplanes roseus]RAI45192.1 hypothetical protein CH341_05350 [Rhodoplanes roseus]